MSLAAAFVLLMPPLSLVMLSWLRPRAKIFTAIFVVVSFLFITMYMHGHWNLSAANVYFVTKIIPPNTNQIERHFDVFFGKFFGSIFAFDSDSISMLLYFGMTLLSFLISLFSVDVFSREKPLSSRNTYLLLYGFTFLGAVGLPGVLALVFVGGTIAYRSKVYDDLIEGTDVIKDQLVGALYLAVKKKILVFSRAGVKIHSYLRIAFKTFQEGVLLVSQPGGGKTNLAFHYFINDADISRRRLFIYDYKGDFTEAFGHRDDVLIVSATDARSAVWDAPIDIGTTTSFLEFLAIFIPRSDRQSGSDTFFKNACDIVTRIVMMKLKKDHPAGDWTFRHLYEICMNDGLLVEVVGEIDKNFLSLVDAEHAKETAQNILLTLKTNMLSLEPLARQWGNRKDKRLFSISQFFKGESPYRVFILKSNPSFPRLSEKCISLVLELSIRMINSLPDVSADTIRAVMVLDEFQTMPRVESIPTAPRVFRSKGVPLIIGTQDRDRTNTLYSDQGGAKFLDNLGLKLIGRITEPSLTKWAVDLASTKLVKRFRQSMTRSREGRSVTYTTDMVTDNVLHPGLFTSIEEPTMKRPAVFWLVAAGWPIVKLRYPIIPKPRNAPAQIDAPWVRDEDEFFVQQAESAAAAPKKAGAVTAKDPNLFGTMVKGVKVAQKQQGPQISP
jgi:hypothetical protein